jgi:hypothetical protein
MGDKERNAWLGVMPLRLPCREVTCTDPPVEELGWTLNGSPAFVARRACGKMWHVNSPAFIPQMGIPAE